MARPILLSAFTLLLGCALYSAFGKGPTPEHRRLTPREPAAPSLSAPQIATAPRLRIHHVTRGETLSEISKLYYHDAAQWRAIARANGLRRARSLRAGDQLVIPRLANSQRRPAVAAIPAPQPRLEVRAPVEARKSPGPRTVGLALLAVLALSPLAVGCYWIGAICARVPDRDPWKAVIAGLSATMFTVGIVLLVDLFYQITPVSAFVVTLALLAALGFGGRLLMISAIYRLRLRSSVGVWGSAIASGFLIAVVLLMVIGLGDTLSSIFL